MIRKGWFSQPFSCRIIDKGGLFRYSKGMKEKERDGDETELLAGPERGLLLNLAQ